MVFIGVRITVHMVDKLWRAKLTYRYLADIRPCKHNYRGQVIYSLSYGNIQESTFHYGASLQFYVFHFPYIDQTGKFNQKLYDATMYCTLCSIVLTAR